MEDRHIVQMYWDRDDRAIRVTDEKYGHYCRAVAKNILRNNEDAEECVNDTWLNAWNAMPDYRPQELKTFLGKITRNLSFNRYKREHAKKRGGGEIVLILEELGDCVSGTDTVEQMVDRKELVKAVDSFLESIPEKKRRIFVRRYWYADAVSEIAGAYGMLPGTVSKILERTRSGLKRYLAERGFAL